ncbi:lysine N6-hydroxylase [Amphibacillus marinus]|uniref:L-lysine N6-monooxygenase MbtG n=1 Tax=Amphibacillus marinus TaxID=872970 RepID=A0A1H8IHH1_9BACI|nr:SidA/IucD/PvdA family monooxygenase [Amphibacillus marinus]SEN67705.1 lysine N6-hydroxylase [Amphibacillus marinus]
MNETIYDIIGIGIGPYNLGLAALIDEQTELHALFFEQNDYLTWHPGMLINGTDLQVSFLADLTTFANPKSKYTYLNYLHTKNRLYPFFFYHQFEIPRQEYDAYLSWVAKQLSSCQFGHQVTNVEFVNDLYRIEVKDNESKTRHFLTRNIVMGTGAKPNTVLDLSAFPSHDVHHSSQYLYHKEDTIKANNITIIGSGQSAAEIFLDLFKNQDDCHYQLSWFTRSPGHVQLDHSKLGQEIFSPDYVKYFHQLDYSTRTKALEQLAPLRNGVQKDTLHQIYHELYHRSINEPNLAVHIQPLTSLEAIESKNGHYLLNMQQWQQGKSFSWKTNKIILATGYKPNIPEWFNQKIAPLMVYEDQNRFKVSEDHQLIFKDGSNSRFYTHTNLEHSHGSSATNLGLAVDRNIQIINSIMGKEVYQRQTGGIFTSF